MREGNEEDSLYFAVFSAGAFLLGAVIFREIVLRNAGRKYLAAQKQLDLNIGKVAGFKTEFSDGKITLEQNASVLKDIKKKSDAAKVLHNLPDTHREVFEICTEYLAVSAEQLKSVGTGSPRLAAFRRGRETVKQLHRFHLLEWMQTETKILMQDAKIRVTISEKLNAAQKALDLIDSALRFYPNEPQLVDSESALNEFISSIRVSYWIEEADRAVFRGDQQSAVGFYRDALFFLERSDIQPEKKQFVSDKIGAAIEKIRLPDDVKK